jgi:hypothetical protein
MTELERPDPTCADCIAFTVVERGDDGHTRGSCRFRPEMPRIRDDYPYCDHFKVRRERADAVRIPAPKKAKRGRAPTHARDDASLRVQRATLTRPVTGDTEGEISVDRNGLKQVLRELLEEETFYGYPELGPRWQGGTMVLKPENDELQSKELPLESFFHKIVMLRDRLRVLEAKVNGNSKLEDSDKVELQSYISKVYGTLTSFNTLFSDKADHFRSK